MSSSPSAPGVDPALSSRPWDARLARALVRPLAGTPVRPNHLTTLRLLTGLAATLVLARGDAPVWGCLLFALSHFLDHTDGELARMTGQGTPLGHLYDLAADALVTVGLFLGIGLGLDREVAGVGSGMLGLVAGIAVAGIFHLRYLMERDHGKGATRQARLAGFEIEDILYLLPLVAVAGALPPFLGAAALCAPLGLLVVSRQYLRLRGRPAT